MLFRSRRQEVHDHITFRQAAGGCMDRVDVVVRCARTQFGLGQTDRNRLKRRRNDQLTTTSEDLQASDVLEVLTNGNHCIKQRSFVQIRINGRTVRNRRAINRMGRRTKSNTVTANRRIIRRRRVEDVRTVDFLRLTERFDQAKVRRRKLRLIQVVVDSLTSDRVAETDLIMLDRKSTRLNSSHMSESRMPSSA